MRLQRHVHFITHTLTYTLQIYALLVMGWWNENKMTDQYAEEMGFQFWLKRDSRHHWLLGKKNGSTCSHVFITFKCQWIFIFLMLCFYSFLTSRACGCDALNSLHHILVASKKPFYKVICEEIFTTCAGMRFNIKYTCTEGHNFSLIT